MITFKEFRNNTQGQRIDVPWETTGRLKGQCVSLIQCYIQECLGQPAKARGNANNWDETYVREGLGTIAKTPRYGDLIVFNINSYGHIAIYVDENTMYDQNNGYHDNKCAGYDKLRNLGGRVFLRPNANLLPESEEATVGIYQTLADMKIRSGAGTNYKEVTVKQTTNAMRSALTSKNANDTAIIKKGTNFTALEIINSSDGSVWAKNYSGYICIRDANSIYCNKNK
jgi:hypothetical protein